MNTCQRQCQLLWLAFWLFAFAGCGSVVQSYIDDWAEQEKANLPRTVNPQTKIIDVKTGPKELIFINQVTDLTDQEILAMQPQLLETVKRELLNNRVKSEQLKKYAVRMTHVICNEAGQEVTRFTVDPK